MAYSMASHRKTHLVLAAILTFVAAVSFGLASASVYADTAPNNYFCKDGQNTQYDPTSTDPAKNTPCITNDKIPNNKDNAATGQQCNKNSCNLISKYVNPAINFLAGATGLIVTISIVIGGIQYATAAGDPGKVAKARSRIMNSVIAIVAFIFLYVVLNWLIPGGLL